MDVQATAAELEGALGHAFGNPALLELALTHASHSAERDPSGGDYQRLEFLGDAVLQLVVTEHLFASNEDAPEGALSRARSQLVSREALAEVAQRIGLAPYIRLGRGAEQQGTRDQPRVLADVVEAIIGALYLDGGLEVARHAVRRLLAPELRTLPVSGRAVDHKSRLQEHCQRVHRQKPVYRITSESGPPHECVFHAAVDLCGATIGTGSGRSKQEAQQEAAAVALAALAAPEPEV